MNRGACAVLLALLALVGPQAAAHQQKEAVTRVVFNPRTGHIEVMHRFLLHDAEHAIKTLRRGEADILGSPADQSFFADYVHQHFALSPPGGKALPMSRVGHEIEGRSLWVYAETPIPSDLQLLEITHGALLDIWNEQVNLVNVERNGRISSLVLSGAMRSSIVPLDDPD